MDKNDISNLSFVSAGSLFVLTAFIVIYLKMTSVFDYELFRELPDDMKKYHILPELDAISQMSLRNVLLGTPLKNVKELNPNTLKNVKELNPNTLKNLIAGVARCNYMFNSIDRQEPSEIYKSLAIFSVVAVQHFWEKGLFELSKLVAAAISENRYEVLEWCLDMIPEEKLKVFRYSEGATLPTIDMDNDSSGYHPLMSLLAAKYGCVDALNVLLRRKMMLSHRIFEVAGKYQQREVLLMLKEPKRVPKSTPTPKCEITKRLGLPPVGRYAKREQNRHNRR
jgi:hypothetical protein